MKLVAGYWFLLVGLSMSLQHSRLRMRRRPEKNLLPASAATKLHKYWGSCSLRTNGLTGLTTCWDCHSAGGAGRPRTKLLAVWHFTLNWSKKVGQWLWGARTLQFDFTVPMIVSGTSSSALFLAESQSCDTAKGSSSLKATGCFCQRSRWKSTSCTVTGIHYSVTGTQIPHIHFQLQGRR